MNSEYLRGFARRCRELMRRVNSDSAKEQLQMWAEEFDRRAETPDSQGASAASPGSRAAGPTTI